VLVDDRDVSFPHDPPTSRRTVSGSWAVDANISVMLG